MSDKLKAKVYNSKTGEQMFLDTLAENTFLEDGSTVENEINKLKNSNVITEVQNARGSYSVLGNRLDNINLKIEENTNNISFNITEINNIKNNYAMKTDVNTLTSDKADKTDLATTNRNVATNTTNIGINSARIDALTSLPSGSTTGDAELIDARTVNGKTYSNLGGSVRAISSGEALGDKSVSLRNLNDDIINFLNSEYMSYLLDESHIKTTGHTNIGANTYIINRPIYPNTYSKIKRIKIYCNKSNTHNYVYIGLGYFTNNKFKIYDIIEVDCINGVNTFEVDVPIDKNYTSYVCVTGAISFTADATDYYYEISGQQIATGEYDFTSTTSKLNFEIAINVTDEKSEKIHLLENRVEELESREININKNYSPLISEKFTTDNSNWTYTGCSTSTEGLILTSGATTNFKKTLAMDDYIFSAKFKLTNVSSKFGLITLGGWSSKYILDTTTKTLNLYTNYTDTTPIKTLDVSSLEFNINENYILKLIRDGWDYELTVIRVKTMESKSIKFSNYDTTTERKYTRASGYFGVSCVDGEVVCNDLLLNINNKECDCLIIGDSLVEGDQVENSLRWARRIKNNFFNGNCVVSGFGGDGAEPIKTKLQNYIDLGIKFKYCIVLCGMNNRKDGGVDIFKTNIDTMYNAIIAQNAVPIIATNPIPSTGIDYITEMRDYVLEKGWNTIRFDLVLSLNNDGATHDASLFNSDGVHPNALGDEKRYNEALRILKALIN